MPNGDPTLYFCGSEETKALPNPIGYLSKDAPACEFFAAKESEPKVFVILPHAVPSIPPPERIAIDVQIIKIASTISLVLSLLGWLASEVDPKLVSIMKHLLALLHF
jgi:hypothetical protein